MGYPITQGANSTWTQGDDGSLVFRSSGSFTSFTGVIVDGKPIIKDIDYTIADGSTIITLKPEYLSTLALGKHIMCMTFAGGYSLITFTIGEKAPYINPFTDVDEGSYCYDAVLWAVKEKIADGTTTTTFSPVKDCTRGKIVTFLLRQLGK